MGIRKILILITHQFNTIFTVTPTSKNIIKKNPRNSMKKIPNLLPLLLLLPLIQPITTSCGDNCNTCSSTTQSCLQCTSTTYIAIASTPIKGCLPCRPGCKSCTSEYSTCVSCAPGYYMNSTAGKCMGCLGSFCDSCD